jgi:zinc/manganese transport system substrate-binding protein
MAGMAGVLTLAGCASDEQSRSDSVTDRAIVVVTTNILGEVVENLVGDELQVVTIMPVGSDPHGFEASAQQVAQLGAADVIVVNGAGFEEGLLDIVEAAEGDGVPVFEAIGSVETIGSSIDPHFFSDPGRMALAAEGIVEFLIDNVDRVDAAGLKSNAAAYIAKLESLDSEVEAMLDAISADRRVLVTNHEVFAYFAERYGFEVVGTIIPSGTTVDAASAQELVELAAVIEREGVPVIFADTSSSGELAATLAAEVGDIDVVELFSESLGPDGSGGETYLSMVRTNAERIAKALAG